MEKQRLKEEQEQRLKEERAKFLEKSRQLLAEIGHTNVEDEKPARKAGGSKVSISVCLTSKFCPAMHLFFPKVSKQLNEW